MGEPYTQLPGYESTSIETVLDWLEYGELGARRRFLQGPLKYLKKDAKWIYACKSVKELAENMIQRGRAIQKEQEKQPMTEQKQRTLMDRFIEGFEDPIELRSIVIQFLMGTAANQTGRLTYICHQLSNSPTVWNRLRENVKSQGQGELNAKTVRQMHYISKTFDEGSSRTFLPHSCSNTN
jgi:cytochrome P450